MYALRERRQHVTQEDFEFAVAKVRAISRCSMGKLNECVFYVGLEEEPGRKHVR